MRSSSGSKGSEAFRRFVRKVVLVVVLIVVLDLGVGMAEGKIILTGSDVIRIFDLMHRIEQEEAAAEREADLIRDYRKAVQLLADVVGKLSTERMRLEIRGELRRHEARGQRAATIAREACRRWNDICPAADELADGLAAAT